MRRYLIVYKGRVQGVGFRYRLYNIANKYHCTGYAKNLYNGDVEVEVQGDEVDSFLKESLSSYYFIEIDDYYIKDLPIKSDEKDFRVRY